MIFSLLLCSYSEKIELEHLTHTHKHTHPSGTTLCTVPKQPGLNMTCGSKDILLTSHIGILPSSHTHTRFYESETPPPHSVYLHLWHPHPLLTSALFAASHAGLHLCLCDWEQRKKMAEMCIWKKLNSDVYFQESRPGCWDDAQTWLWEVSCRNFLCQCFPKAIDDVLRRLILSHSLKIFNQAS